MGDQGTMKLTGQMGQLGYDQLIGVQCNCGKGAKISKQGKLGFKKLMKRCKIQNDTLYTVLYVSKKCMVSNWHIV